MTSPTALLDSFERWRGRPVDLFAKLMEQEEVLTRHGFPPMSDWWKATLRDFYRSGKRRLVLRVGRRGGKSSTLCRVAVVETLYGAHSVPPGDVGYFILVSTTKGEASSRLVTIRAILDVLGVAHHPVDSGVAIEGKNVGFKVYPATIAGVSGPTGIGFMGDELAKWRDSETGANPAKQVLASLTPTMATQPTAKAFLSSSPFSTIDAHAEAFDRGTTESQTVAHAPTWVANPTISEADTRELEPDEPTRLREYGAIPMSSGTHHWFDSSTIQAAVESYELPVVAQPGTVLTAGGDCAFVNDSAALVVGHLTPGPTSDLDKFRLGDLDEVQPEPGAPLMPSIIVKRFAARLRALGVGGMMADGHYKMTVVEHFIEAGLGFLDAPTVVAEPYVRLRVLLQGNRCALPDHPRLLNQLRQVMWRPTPNNMIQIIQPRNGPGGGHGDLVSALVLAAWQRGGTVVQKAPEWQTDELEQQRIQRMAEKREKEWWTE